jgi:hypothetical protein
VIDVAFLQLLSSDDEVEAIADGRVYFDVRPQNERQPSIVLNLISATPGMTFKGRGGYVNGRMQVNCSAPTKSQAKSLAQAARDALDGYVGTTDGTMFSYILTQNFRDIPVVVLPGAATPASYGVSIDALFMAAE